MASLGGDGGSASAESAGAAAAEEEEDPMHLTLTAGQAASTPFPPSCPVLVYSNSADGEGGGAGSVSAYLARVSSAYIDLAGDRGTHYRVVVATQPTGGGDGDGDGGNGRRETVRPAPEGDLRFAPGCPVTLGGEHSGSSRPRSATVASCIDGGGGETFYVVQIVENDGGNDDGGGVACRATVPSSAVKFRPPPPAAVPAREERLREREVPAVPPHMHVIPADEDSVARQRQQEQQQQQQQERDDLAVRREAAAAVGGDDAGNNRRKRDSVASSAAPPEATGGESASPPKRPRGLSPVGQAGAPSSAASPTAGEGADDEEEVVRRIDLVAGLDLAKVRDVLVGPAHAVNERMQSKLSVSIHVLGLDDIIVGSPSSVGRPPLELLLGGGNLGHLAPRKGDRCVVIHGDSEGRVERASRVVIHLLLEECFDGDGTEGRTRDDVKNDLSAVRQVRRKVVTPSSPFPAHAEKSPVDSSVASEDGAKSRTESTASSARAPATPPPTRGRDTPPAPTKDENRHQLQWSPLQPEVTSGDKAQQASTSAGHSSSAGAQQDFQRHLSGPPVVGWGEQRKPPSHGEWECKDDDDHSSHLSGPPGVVHRGDAQHHPGRGHGASSSENGCPAPARQVGPDKYEAIVWCPVKTVPVTAFFVEMVGTRGGVLKELERNLHVEQIKFRGVGSKSRNAGNFSDPLHVVITDSNSSAVNDAAVLISRMIASVSARYNDKRERRIEEVTREQEQGRRQLRESAKELILTKPVRKNGEWVVKVRSPVDERTTFANIIGDGGEKKKNIETRLACYVKLHGYALDKNTNEKDPLHVVVMAADTKIATEAAEDIAMLLDSATSCSDTSTNVQQQPCFENTVRAAEKVTAMAAERDTAALLYHQSGERHHHPPIDSRPDCRRPARARLVGPAIWETVVWWPADKVPIKLFYVKIMGSNGKEIKALEREFGCRLDVRGRGSRAHASSTNDPLRVIITGPTSGVVDNAADRMTDMITSIAEHFHETRQRRLQEITRQEQEGIRRLGEGPSSLLMAMPYRKDDDWIALVRSSLSERETVGRIIGQGGMKKRELEARLSCFAVKLIKDKGPLHVEICAVGNEAERIVIAAARDVALLLDKETSCDTESARAPKEKRDVMRVHHAQDRFVPGCRDGKLGKYQPTPAKLPPGRGMWETTVWRPINLLEEKLSFSFVKERVIGPGGCTHRDLEKRFDCEIKIRGKGSGTTGKYAADDEPLHILIFGRCSHAVNDAAECITSLLLSGDGRPSGAETHPRVRRKLRDSAESLIMTGPYKEGGEWHVKVRSPLDENKTFAEIIGSKGCNKKKLMTTLKCNIQLRGFASDKRANCGDPLHVLVSAADKAVVMEGADKIATLFDVLRCKAQW